MKIIVFGGSFNPPHRGHLLMAEQLLTQAVPNAFAKKEEIEKEKIIFDQLWFLPVGKHSFGKGFESAKNRLAMLEALISDLLSERPELKEKVRIEKHELEESEVSHTADSLDYLRAKYPQHQFAFLIGSDNLAKFHLWEDRQNRPFNYLLESYPFYVYPRENFPFQPLYTNMWPLRNLPMMDVSSTDLRQKLATRKNYQQLLSPSVLSYIENQKLYGEK